MKIKTILASFLIVFCSLTTLSQSVEFTKQNFPNKKKELKEAKKNIRSGDRQFYEAESLKSLRDQKDTDSNFGLHMYLYALEDYLKAYKLNNSNALLNYRIGLCYFYTIEKTKSIPFFESAHKLDPKIAPDVLYLLAQAYHLNYEFDKAVNTFNEFRAGIPRNELSRDGWRKKLDAHIEQCINGMELMLSPVDVKIEKLSNVINSEFPDYNPIVSADESMMVFTSRRGKESEKKKGVEPLNYVEDIYISYNKNGQWSKPVNPGAPLNSDMHESVVGLSPDGQKIFIYKGTEGGNIYESVLEGSTWSKPEKLPAPISSAFYEGSASFSPDGRTVYFISERPGGRGGSDIYVATKDRRGMWGPASNLGKTINTEFDEKGVFMHPDGITLYFSSQGHNSMGGFDIFKSQKQGRRGWTTPENLGYPINTTGDDLFYTVTANGKHGYFSSSKEGTHNIYKITFEESVNLLTLVKGLILDEETKLPIHAEIDIVDLSTNEDIANFFSNSVSGNYLVALPSGGNYGISVKADGYLFYSENFNLDSAAVFEEVNRDIYLKKIKVGSIIVLNNIFFDFGKATLRQESTDELLRVLKILNDNPNIGVEISGHTDNVGSALINKQLSTERAKAVVEYLIKNGINASRLTYMGYGFDSPIAPNNTEEGRQMNRRTEFKIITTN